MSVEENFMKTAAIPVALLEDTMTNSEKLFRKLFEMNCAIMMLIDPETGDIIQANKSASDFYGWSMEQLSTMRIQQINTLPPETVMKKMQMTLSTGSLQWEFEHRKADGSFRDVEVFSSKIDMAQQKILCSIVHDITDRKRTEMRLLESEAQYRMLFESASDALFLIATDTGQIIHANHQASVLYGYDREELRTKKSWELSAEPAETRHLTLQERSISDPVAAIPLRLHQKKDGAVFPVEITSRMFPLEEREVLLVAVRDITERRQAEDERVELEARDQQVRKFESLSRMASAIAHLFNNQLQVVTGNLELARGEIPQDSIAAKSLEASLKAARRAARISGSMLAYQGLSFHTQHLLNLSEICHRYFCHLQKEVPTNITVKTDFSDSDAVIYTNADQIKQILTILTTNAVEAIGRNPGTIRLTVKKTAHSDIPASNRFPISWQPQKNVYACLEVADTGCGILPENIDNLFDPYFTTKFIGRGMGLSLALGIMQPHGGVITVESEPAGGSVFRVFFPISV